MMKVPRINVPVLYPLGFEPGEKDGWIETVNECFMLAMGRLHEQVIGGGWVPDQGVVTGPHLEVEGVTVPSAIGFTPNDGEQPKPLTNQAEAEMKEIADVPFFERIKGFGVFMKNEDGDMAPCVTETKHVFLIYQDGAEAWERALEKEGAQVMGVQVLWDGEADARRKKSGRRR